MSGVACPFLDVAFGPIPHPVRLVNKKTNKKTNKLFVFRRLTNTIQFDKQNVCFSLVFVYFSSLFFMKIVCILGVCVWNGYRCDVEHHGLHVKPQCLSHANSDERTCNAGQSRPSSCSRLYTYNGSSSIITYPPGRIVIIFMS